MLLGEEIASLDSIGVIKNIYDKLNNESYSNELGCLNDNTLIKYLYDCLEKLF